MLARDGGQNGTADSPLRALWSRLIRFAFRLLYNELAWTYDAVSWLVSLGDWRQWQRAALPYVRGSHVLELAHGPGHVLLALRAAGYRTVGLDLSPYMGRQAQRRLRRAGREAPLLRGRAEALPLPEAYFDTVLSTFPTEFIVAPETLAAVHRVLKHDGRFVFVPEGHFTGRDPLVRFLEWLYAITGQRSGDFALDEAQRWPAADLRALLEARFTDAGFSLTFAQVTLPRSSATVVIAEKQRPL